jgi:hypothetical protein
MDHQELVKHYSQGPLQQVADRAGDKFLSSCAKVLTVYQNGLEKPNANSDSSSRKHAALNPPLFSSTKLMA